MKKISQLHLKIPYKIDKKQMSSLCNLSICAFIQNNIRFISSDLSVNYSKTNFKPVSISPQPGVSIKSIAIFPYLNCIRFKSFVTPSILLPSMNCLSI